MTFVCWLLFALVARGVWKLVAMAEVRAWLRECRTEFAFDVHAFGVSRAVIEEKSEQIFTLSKYRESDASPLVPKKCLGGACALIGSF